MGVQGLTYDPAGSMNSGNAQSITSDDGSAQVFSDRMACHGQNLNEKHPQLSPQFQNGWTYKSNPNVVFFEADPGVYAYSDDGFKTIKAVDNKAISVIVKNGGCACS